MKKHKRDSLRIDTYFYRAIRKYGWNNFEWAIIDDTASSKEELNTLERYYIKQYDSFNNREKGYNSTSGGERNYQITEEERKNRSLRVKGNNNPFSSSQNIFSWKGKRFSEEHKKHLSESLKNRDMPWVKGSNNVWAEPIINLMTLEQFGSISEAAAKYNVSSNTISRNLRGITNYCQGYKWKYLKEISDVSSLVPLKRNVSALKKKPVICLETNIVYDSLSSAMSQLHIAAKTIKECCDGTRESYKGLHFQYYLNDTVPTSKEKGVTTIP